MSNAVLILPSIIRYLMTTICTWPVREVMCRRGWSQSRPQFYQVCRSTGANLHCGGNIILWIWKGKRAHWNALIWLLAWSESMYHPGKQYAGYFFVSKRLCGVSSNQSSGFVAESWLLSETLWWNKNRVMWWGRTSREYQISTIYWFGRRDIMILFHRFIGWCQCIELAR